MRVVYIHVVILLFDRPYSLKLVDYPLYRRKNHVITVTGHIWVKKESNENFL